MTWDQLYGWLEYEELEPFGELRADLRHGILASIVANMFRGSGHAALTPADLMPYLGGDPEPEAKVSEPVSQLESWERFKGHMKANAGLPK